MRFKPENIIIAGIIPGPQEPKKGTINSYLRPLVKELNSLWIDGFVLQLNSQNIVVHAALIATVCDIPATCKIGGFLGHNSCYPCWKCSRRFQYSTELKRIDFSGTTVGNSRTQEEHKRNAIKSLSACTPTEQNKLELESGSRFTQLMYLPYYDCVRYAIIDPMHNMFLGTAKTILQTEWLQNSLITRESCYTIQERINDFCTM